MKKKFKWTVIQGKNHIFRDNLLCRNKFTGFDNHTANHLLTHLSDVLETSIKKDNITLRLLYK